MDIKHYKDNERKAILKQIAAKFSFLRMVDNSFDTFYNKQKNSFYIYYTVKGKTYLSARISTHV